MQLYIAIDDTDNHESPGSGQLAEILAGELHASGLVVSSSAISRHQLHFCPEIPYTSHNSAMCFRAETAGQNKEAVIAFTGEFLQRRAARGSDPGLCVAAAELLRSPRRLIEFGLEAKRAVLSKQAAYDLAATAGLHLSEHGGTGEGVIGALAGVGLRLEGNDGRFRGWFDLESDRDLTCAEMLRSIGQADDVVDDRGTRLAADTPVRLTGGRLKTVRLGHRRVIPVIRAEDDSGPFLRTLDKAEFKAF